MKITFICGSIEPGRNGVGDYTRRLAGEIISSGHFVEIIAVNENNLKESKLNLIQKEGTVPILTHRLSGYCSWKKRQLIVSNIISKFNPEMISLQFVPYSYHKKGLPWGFVKMMTSIGKQYRYHIMFHEIWIDPDGKFKLHLISQIQKLIIKRLAAALKPELINVSIPYNQLKLQEENICSRILGLFGNIPAKECVEFLKKTKKKEPESINILYFGAPPRGEFKMQVLNGLKNFSSKSVSEIKILVVGGNSKLKDEFVFCLNECLSQYNVKILDLGFLDIYDLSCLLKTSSVGIARSAPFLLGKSGSAISMLEHGLPIWMPKLKSNYKVDYDFRSELIFNSLEKAISYKNKPKPHSLLPMVAQEFINQFKL